MKKVLVTGANGFIGKSCLPLLLEKGYEVHAVSTGEINSDKIHWHRADLLDPEQVRNLLRKLQPSHLLHLAWVTTPGKYWSSLENFAWVQSGIELVKAFHENDGKRVVTAGTCAEYDWHYGLCSEKTTPAKPSTVYGTCKSVMERLQDSFSAETGLSAAWGRIFFIYGPDENINRLIPAVINSLLKGKEISCTDAKQVRDFMHVHDVAAAFVTLLESEVNGPFNIASGPPVILKDMINFIAGKLNGTELVQFGRLPAPANDPPVLTADISKLLSLTEWKPQYSLEEGLEDTIEWWRVRDESGRRI